jgi:hypothetical protein
LTATWRVPFPSLTCGGMDLGDGGRGNRRIEARIKLVDRPAERSFDFGAGKRFREGRHAVLKTRKIIGDLGADHVGAGGEKLAELDPGRPKPLDGTGQPVGAFGSSGLAPGQQAGNPMAKPGRRRKLVGGQRRNHALAHKDEARPHQAQIGTETCHAGQIFQAE